jgi:hypothetical protein
MKTNRISEEGTGIETTGAKYLGHMKKRWRNQLYLEGLGTGKLSLILHSL